MVIADINGFLKKVGKIHYTFKRFLNRFRRSKKTWKNLFAFFLYTNEDQVLKSYLEDHQSELHSISGSNVLIYFLKEEEVYENANKLNIKFTKIPCIVFFLDPEDKNIFIYKIEEKESIKEQMRKIFTYAKKCCDKHRLKSKKYKCLKKKLTLQKFGKKIAPILLEIGKKKKF